MREQVLQFLKDAAMPVVVITHDPDDVEAFGQTLVFFEQGRTFQIDDSLNKSLKFPSMTDFLLSLQQEFRDSANTAP